uniref:Transmembrane protein 176l.4 n=1 Tax=Monopterus albus TaxID=43700 RepID=A0A3Q3Q6Z8_MONAL|nr:transmembrane protein 176A-like [Monopterus albus]
MSIAMTNADGVTVITLTSDTKSTWPPLCQILKALCYNPLCCSVSQQIRGVQRASQTVLGALQIMVGALTIGLAVINNHRGPDPFWLGAMFLLVGAVCILSDKYPSPCLVIINVILNLAGVGFAIADIVVYSSNMYVYMWQCTRDRDYGYYYHRTTPSPSPQEEILVERCLEFQDLRWMLLQSISIVLIVLSVLELCLTISSVILGIKALRSIKKGESKSTADPECYKPLLEEVTNQ